MKVLFQNNFLGECKKLPPTLQENNMSYSMYLSEKASYAWRDTSVSKSLSSIRNLQARTPKTHRNIVAIYRLAIKVTPKTNITVSCHTWQDLENLKNLILKARESTPAFAPSTIQIKALITIMLEDLECLSSTSELS